MGAPATEIDGMQPEKVVNILRHHGAAGGGRPGQYLGLGLLPERRQRGHREDIVTALA